MNPSNYEPRKARAMSGARAGTCRAQTEFSASSATNSQSLQAIAADILVNRRMPPRPRLNAMDTSAFNLGRGEAVCPVIERAHRRLGALGIARQQKLGLLAGNATATARVYQAAIANR